MTVVTEFIVIISDKRFGPFDNLKRCVEFIHNKNLTDGELIKREMCYTDGNISYRSTVLAEINNGNILVNAYIDLNLVKYYDHEYSLMVEGGTRLIPITECLYVSKFFFPIDKADKLKNTGFDITFF